MNCRAPELGDVLWALAHPVRRAIVCMLLDSEICVGELARRLKLTPAAVSQHLRVLRQARIARGEKRGYYTHYVIDRDVLRWAASELTVLANRPEPQTMCDASGCTGKCHAKRQGR